MLVRCLVNSVRAHPALADKLGTAALPLPGGSSRIWWGMLVVHLSNLVRAHLALVGMLGTAALPLL